MWWGGGGGRGGGGVKGCQPSTTQSVHFAAETLLSALTCRGCAGLGVVAMAGSYGNARSLPQLPFHEESTRERGMQVEEERRRRVRLPRDAVSLSVSVGVSAEASSCLSAPAQVCWLVTQCVSHVEAKGGGAFAHACLGSFLQRERKPSKMRVFKPVNTEPLTATEDARHMTR